MTHPSYDVIVIGTGGVGSAALFHLARRGQRVLGIDQFPVAHDRGSSHGQTRIIRQAYFEHSDYVPLLVRAYRLWEELEELAGQKLLFPVGLIEVGPPDGVVIPGVMHAAEKYGLEVERLSPTDLQTRFPGMVSEQHQAVFEAAAGYLLVEECVSAHVRLACQAGAEYLNAAVQAWSRQAAGVVVRTTKGEYRARQVVICGGAWSRQLLAEIGLPLRVTAKHLYWCPADSRYDSDDGCPTFFYELPAGYFYGFPQIDARGVKVSEHSGGVEVPDPDALDRTSDLHDKARVMDFVRRYLTGVTCHAQDHSVCMYTMSPDEHFVVDRHPEWPNIVFAAGLSGHGFKFTPVLGEVLADLATEGQTTLPIDFLRLNRFDSGLT